MPVGRDINAKLKYLSLDKDDKIEMIRNASCDEFALIGYLNYFQMGDFDSLAQIRKRKLHTKSDFYRQRSDFFAILAKISKRIDRINEIKQERNFSV